eukprot:COSAG01_NODE_2751_length_7146_cov_21.649922_1_plen_91_part_00
MHELAESVAALQDQLKDQQEAMGTILDMLDRSITVAVRADCHAMRTHIFSLAQVLREWVLHLRSGHGRAAARAGNPAAASAGRAGRRVKS